MITDPKFLSLLTAITLSVKVTVLTHSHHLSAKVTPLTHSHHFSAKVMAVNKLENLGSVIISSLNFPNLVT